MSEPNQWRLEVKVTTAASHRKPIEGETIWLNWDDFKVVPLPKNQSKRVLVSDGHTAFTILAGKSRDKFLTEQGFDPRATWSPEAEQEAT